MSKAVVHKYTETPAFGGTLRWDALCGAELWNGGLLEHDNSKVTCDACIRILQRRSGSIIAKSKGAK